MRQYLYWAGGEMVDAQCSERCRAICAGSSPALPTLLALNKVKYTGTFYCRDGEMVDALP